MIVAIYANLLQNSDLLQLLRINNGWNMDAETGLRAA